MLSLGESDLLDDKSDNDWSYSGSSGTCTFPLCFYEPVGRLSGLGSVVFVPIEVDSKCDVVTFLFLFQKESSSKVVDSLKTIVAPAPDKNIVSVFTC